MIDLRKVKKEISLLLSFAIDEFEKQFPNEKLFTIAFNICPINGWLTVNIDTLGSSESFVGGQNKDEYSHLGIDKFGYFNNNCSEFKYTQFMDLEDEGWRYEYQNNYKEFGYIDLSGKVYQLDLSQVGRESIDKIIYEVVKEVIDNDSDYLINSSKNRENMVRVGVQMFDSHYRYFKASIKK